MLALITAEKRQERMAALVVKVASQLQIQAEELSKELVQNLPEYGNQEWISCTDFDYDKDEFTFDVEDPDREGKFSKMVISSKDLSLTIPLFWMAVQAKESNPYALACEGSDFWDAGHWDQPAMDCLLQYHFYGECVFG